MLKTVNAAAPIPSPVNETFLSKSRLVCVVTGLADGRLSFCEGIFRFLIQSVFNAAMVDRVIRGVIVTQAIMSGLIAFVSERIVITLTVCLFFEQCK